MAMVILPVEMWPTVSLAGEKDRLWITPVSLLSGTLIRPMNGPPRRLPMLPHAGTARVAAFAWLSAKLAPASELARRVVAARVYVHVRMRGEPFEHWIPRSRP